MNFYKHHIGDYDADTAHLSMLEDAAYSRLMRAYYRTERPIPAEIKQACRLVRANSKPERDAVVVVLNEFFELKDDGWHNKRCNEELTSYTEQAATNRRIAVAREAARKKHEPCNDSLPKREPNHTPESTNQNPELKPKDTLVVNPSTATAVCVVLKSEGIASVNAQHPELLELIADGAQIGEFVEAARIAKDKNKGFAYALGVVRNSRADVVGRANTPHQLSKKAQGIRNLQELIDD